MTNGAVGAAIFGDLLNFAGTAYTNETNSYIADKNREMQISENRKQRDWEEKMKLQEQQYNTPSAQMERYKQAGLNPFLMGADGQVSSGQIQAPAPPPLQSSPSMPNLVAPHFNGLGIAQLMQQDRRIDSDVAFQESQVMRSAIDGYIRLSEDGNLDAANKVLNFGLARLGHFNTDSSFYRDQARLQLEVTRLDKSMKELEYNIQSEVGLEKAIFVNKKLKTEYENIAEHTNLYKTLEGLNKANERLSHAKTDRERSEINVNIARYKSLLAQAARDFSQSEYLSELGLTQSTVNKYFDYTTKTQALMLGFDYDEAKADYESNEFIRKFKSTSTSKKQSLWDYNMDVDTNPIFKTLKSVGDVISPFRGLSKPSIPAKYKRFGHMPNGDKLIKEWYDY